MNKNSLKNIEFLLRFQVHYDTELMSDFSYHISRNRALEKFHSVKTKKKFLE